MTMLMPPDPPGNVLVEVGKLSKTLEFVLLTLDKMQAKLDQSKTTNEIEAKWEEQDRRIDENAANIRELQTWRVSLYQQTGKEQLELTKDLSNISKRNDDLTISRSQALIGTLIMVLLGLLVYIAQHAK